MPNISLDNIIKQGWSRVITKRSVLTVMLTVYIMVIGACCVCTGSPSEYEVKAVFIYNFAKFAEWPSGTFDSSDAPIIIGTIGDDPFDGALEQAVRNKTANGRRLVIRHFERIQDCNACHILFICSSERSRLSRIFDRLKNSSVLTIGESEGFAQHGGVIGFVVDNDKIGFEVNIGAAGQADIRISSKLLKLAKAVIE